MDIKICGVCKYPYNEDACPNPACSANPAIPETVKIEQARRHDQLVQEEAERARIEKIRTDTAKRERRNRARRERHAVMVSMGLKRVRGALGGVYYE